MTMETRCSKVIFPNYSKKKPAERYARTAAMGNTEKNVCFSRIICSRCCARRNLRFHVENCQHVDQKQLTRRQAFDLDIEATHGKPGSCRTRPVNVDDGLEHIRWIRALGGEELPATSYALLPNLEKGLFFAIGEASRISVACFLHSSAKMCLYQTPGRRPPPITCRFVNTVTKGWVGAPNERVPFRFHGAVVDFVDRCLPRTRNPAASNIHLAEFFSCRSWPKIGPGNIFFGVFEKFFFFFKDLCS